MEDSEQKVGLAAKISIQSSGRVYLTITENGKEMLRDRVSCRAVAELRINALQEARGQLVSVTIEDGL